MKKILYFIVTVFLLTVFPTVSFADETGSAFLSGVSSAYAGDTVTLTLGFNASKTIAGVEYVISVDGCLELVKIDSLNGTSVSNVNGNVMQTVFSIQGLDSGTTWANIVLKINEDATVGSTGNVTISSIGLSLDDVASTTYIQDVSKQITVEEKPVVTQPEPQQPPQTQPQPQPQVNKETKSNDAQLKELKINGLDDFDFNPEVYEYEITVGNDIEKLEIEAVANNEKANFEISGNEELIMGENTITITVTAEDSTQQVYTLKVTRTEEDTTAIKNDDKDNQKEHRNNTENKKDNEKMIWIVMTFSLLFVIIAETAYLIYDKKKRQM